jgi:hypothetical protein
MQQGNMDPEKDPLKKASSSGKKARRNNATGIFEDASKYLRITGFRCNRQQES